MLTGQYEGMAARNDSEMARDESDAQPHQPLLALQIERAGFCESLSGMLIPK
jgi:hypothetical protein